MDKSISAKNTPLWLLSLIVTLPTFFAFLATSAANVAMPHIAGTFGSTNDEVKWVVTSYLVANGIFLPLTGWLERTLGRVGFLRLFIGIFTAGSFVCAIAPNLITLILGRVIQGVGGGVLMPLVQSILLQEFPRERQNDAMAIFIFAVMVSSISGPTVGGMLADNFSWQWIFIINIPIGIFSIFAIPIFVPDTKRDTSKDNVDYMGFVFLILWLFSMQIVLDKGQQYGWFDCTWICWLSWFALTCMLLFIVWELEIKKPIVNLRVLKNVNFLVGTILASLINLLVSVTIILIPLFFQGLMHYTAAKTGLLLLTRLVACIPLLFMGQICRVIPLKVCITIGIAMVGTSIALCANLNLSASPNTMILSNLFFGIGSVFAMVPITTMAFGTLDKDKIPSAAGVHGLIKCVTASMCTSLASSFAIRLSQVHQTYLLKNMTEYNPIFTSHLASLKDSLMSFNSAFDAGHKASVLMYEQLLVQTKLCAIADLFQFAAFVTFLSILLVLFFKKRANTL